VAPERTFAPRRIGFVLRRCGAYGQKRTCPYPVRVTSAINDQLAASNQLFFVPIAGNALIFLRDNVSRSKLALCKPPILSTNTS